MKHSESVLPSLVTVVIPVRNEAANLSGCLASVRDFPHVVIVDSGSTDGTRAAFEAARTETGRDGWEWVDFRWNGQFPKKRNWILRNHAFATPWVLFLDADERVTEGWRREAAARLGAADGVDAWICRYDNWFMGRMLRHGDRMRKTAVLRIGRGEYERIDEKAWSALDMEIHEHLQVGGEIGEIRAPLEHHDHRSLGSYLAKHEEYAKWEAGRYRELTGNATAPGRARLTRRQRVKYALITRRWFGFAYFCASYVLKRGFLDGKAGFWFAWYKMRYFGNIRRKIVGRTA